MSCAPRVVDGAGSALQVKAGTCAPLRPEQGTRQPPSGGKLLMSTGLDLISLIASRQNLDDYQKKHWCGSFAEYLDVVKRDPSVTRTAYHRLYDMIMSKGTEEIIVNKEKLVRYKFFEDPDNNGEDAIFGLERTLTSLVNILKS